MMARQAHIEAFEGIGEGNSLVQIAFLGAA